MERVALKTVAFWTFVAMHAVTWHVIEWQFHEGVGMTGSTCPYWVRQTGRDVNENLPFLV